MTSIKFLSVDIALSIAGAAASIHEQAVQAPLVPSSYQVTAAGVINGERYLVIIQAESRPSIADLHEAISRLNAAREERWVRPIAGDCHRLVFTIDEEGYLRPAVRALASSDR